mmetsp:Transcript_43124/g.69131  ORF Transcript_43124/g.69131 Transcript_43124/m.69131 type:complete len:138 (-) Transcript_43124:105-518(-)|eukprot:CAMPEP_0197021430 /NCGR_PEP_ID=MMETSP1384-20130603/2306_1 /TAXON_ID=29189 /ORGANISM="Ammonia sp." /LENGTH=137 /DNA_ID=CAMNT_0042449251 /DNA_START=40 /DNA_END=453 /DNA_ORIENTATION=-
MDSLSQTIRQVLEEKGVLSELKARIRAEIFESLQFGKEMGVTDADDKHAEHTDKQQAQQSNKLQWSKHELVINELIKEYLSFHGLHHSLSVFLSETNDKRSDKINLETELGIERATNDKDQDRKSHPILYDILPIEP